jgi:hypothetical protein
MLGEEEGLFGDLTDCSLGQRSDGCNRAARSDCSGDLSSGESEFLHKINTQEDGRLLVPFVARRREGRWYRGGEIIDSEWSYSMLPF